MKTWTRQNAIDRVSDARGGSLRQDKVSLEYLIALEKAISAWLKRVRSEREREEFRVKRTFTSAFSR